jgi:hypothetical protein
MPARTASKQGYVVLSSDERALWRPRLHSEHDDPFPGMLCWPSATVIA